MISYKEIIMSLFIFFGVLYLISILFRTFSLILQYPLPSLWPTHIYYFIIPNIIEIIISISILLLFSFFIVLFFKKQLKLTYIIVIGTILIISTNLIHGWSIGLANPVVGGEIQFFHDAIKIENPFIFLKNFEENQANLLVHSRTHPPGAVLTFFLLYKIFIYPSLISLVICIFSTTTSAYFLFKILNREIDNEISLYITLLFLLLPAVQIFYLANLYAIVCSLFLGSLYFYMHPKIHLSIVGTIFCLFLTAFITFMFFFILIVIIIFEIINKRSVKSLEKILVIVLSLFFIYFMIFIIFSFNYINSFLIASNLENPDGFMLIADPTSYFFTRFENVLEILIFMGPLLIYLLVMSFKNIKIENSNLNLLGIIGPITLLFFFLLGVYRTGETARGCLYIYPFFLFPIALYFKNKNPTILTRKKILIIVFSQTLFMQLFYFFFW